MRSIFCITFFLYLPVIRWYAYYTKTNISPIQFSMKIWVLLFFRVFLGMLNNIVISVALKLIPISKGIIIQSSSPIFVFIAASIFLKEHVTKFQLAMTLASIFGVYLMTLNKVDETYDKTYEIIGYLTMCCSPLFYG